MHILVVDDEPGIRSIIQAVLEEEGYSVTTASNGLDALGKIDTHPRPDVILLDINMPVMDGYRFVEAFRAQSWTIPIVVASARDARAASAELGAAAALDKPFDLDTLVQTVRLAAQDRPAGR